MLRCGTGRTGRGEDARTARRRVRGHRRAVPRDEELNLDARDRRVEYLVAEGGVHGIITLGSNGEANSPSEAERQVVMERTIAAVAGRVPVLVGASANATRDAAR